MLKALEIFGFGHSLIKWINVINNSTMSCISYNGILPDYFPLHCGIRQGCPISLLCFIVACEILACKIRLLYQVIQVTVK